MQLFQKLKWITIIIFIGFIISIIFHTCMSLKCVDYPYNTFFFSSKDIFMDFYNVYTADKGLNPYFKFGQLVNYFPLAYVVFFPFTWVSAETAFVLYCGIVLNFIFFALLFLIKKIKNNPQHKQAKILMWATFVSYPLLFCLNRGNIDGLIFVIVSFSLMSFFYKRYYLSSLLLAIATGMKLYPLVFIVLFIKKKLWKESVFCITMLLFLTLLSLAFLSDEGIMANVEIFLRQIHHATQRFVIQDDGLAFSVSLFNLLKIILWYMPPFHHNETNLLLFHNTLNALQPFYVLFTLIAFACISLYVLVVEDSLWKQVMLLTLPMIFFPVISNDYKLIYLYIPCFLFVISRQPDKFDKFYAVLFALLMIPKQYIVVSGPMSQTVPYLSFYSISELLNIILMLFFIVMLISRGRVLRVQDKANAPDLVLQRELSCKY